MTTDSQPTPEQVVADHSFLDDQYACLCQIDSDVDTMDRQEHAAHVLAALRSAGYADPVKLPEPDRYADDEREWAFSGEHFDGFVNLGIADGGVEIDIAMDTGSVDGFTTVAKGFVPLSALHPLAAALLAAADSAERGES